jgi:menaquinol-cytochrome c reductase iron-sulfur subunit
MEHDKSRRRFCIAGLAGIGGVMGLSAIGTGAVFLGSPAVTNRTPGKWVEVGPQEDLEEETFTQVVLEFPLQDGWAYSNQRMLAYVWRKGDELMALSATCQHLGCNVRFDEDRQQFICPCHAGIYDMQGEVVAGPPPRALDRLPVKIEENTLFVFNKKEDGANV